MCKCIIGTDYPKPIVDHDTARKENLEKMNKAYKSGKAAAGKSSSGQSAGKVTKTSTKHKLTADAKDSPSKKKQKTK